MKNPLSNLLKQFFSFSRKDRNGILFLSILVLVLFIVYILLDFIHFNSEQDYSEYRKILERWEAQSKVKERSYETLFLFNPNTITKESIDSLKLPQFIKQNLLNYRKAGGAFGSIEDIRKIYGMNDSIFEVIKPYINISGADTLFNKTGGNEKKKQPPENVFYGEIDPNNATYEKLIDFGFSKFQADNITRYVKKGGRFYTKNDLLKIYGVDSVFFEKVKSHIYIAPSEDAQKDHDNWLKKEVVHSIELNRADTSALIKLKGIGSTFAMRIVKYRDLLGGYNNKNQLLEIYNFPEEIYLNIEEYITVDTAEIEQIRINFANYPQLLRHPYLNKQCVKKILDYRNQNGSYNAVNQLLEENLLDSITYRLIYPYLTCR